MKPEYRIQIYSKVHLEWNTFPFPDGRFDNKEKAIAEAVKSRKAWSKHGHKIRLIEVYEKVIRLPSIKKRLKWYILDFL